MMRKFTLLVMLSLLSTMHVASANHDNWGPATDCLMHCADPVDQHACNPNTQSCP